MTEKEKIPIPSVNIVRCSDCKTRILITAATQLEISYWPYADQNQNQT